MKFVKPSFIGLQSHSLPLRRFFALALLWLSAVSVQALTPLSDDFTNAVRVGTPGSQTGVDVDGGTTNDWMMALSNTTASTQTSDANAPDVATGINGNSLATTGGTFPFSLHRYFTSTTLHAGESISVSLNIRTTAAPTAQDTSFRIGLFDSNIGKIATNSNFSGATGTTVGTVFIDDRGYGAFYDTGASSVSHEIRERTNTTYTATNVINLFRPTDFGNLGTASTVGNTIALNTTYAVILNIARSLDGSSVTTTSTFNGISLSYTDTSALVTEFDHLAIGFGSSWTGTKYLDDVIVTHTPVAPATPVLRAYYPFDGDFTDASGNNNHLTGSSGTPDITTVGAESAVGGGALNLDQSGTQEHLAFTTPIGFTGTTAWSMAWWGRRGTSSAATQGMIAGTITDSNNFVWTPSNATVEGLRLRDSAGASTDYDGIVDDNAYHHWAVVYNDAGSVEVWRDNVSLGSKAFTGSISMTHVGAGTASQTNSFFGQIDELYFYDGAIDAAKVGELFAAGVTDNTPPTLAASGIVSNQGGAPVAANTPVIFTVTFSEDMDAATVDIGDFGNAGTAPVSIVSVTETSPGVFSVVVNPTGTGSLQLKVLAGAVLKDAAGNALATGSAIVGETSITVTPPITRLRVYLLGGQSNADGRAVASGLPTTPVNLQQPQNDVDLFSTRSKAAPPRSPPCARA